MLLRSSICRQSVFVSRRHFVRCISSTASSESTLDISTQELDYGSIAKVTFNRPKAKNAISQQLLDELHEYVMRLATKDPSVEKVRAMVLTSSLPDVFCAGADLKERKTFTPAQTTQFLTKLNDTLTKIQGLEIPTISAVQGLALGGGLEIALSTDFRVMSSTAKFGLPETRLAILPGAGGTHRLPKLIGYSRALDMILTGRRVEASEALSFGLVNRVAEEPGNEAATNSAMKMAEQICEGGPIAINAAKRAVKGRSPDWERAAYEKVVNSKDKFEALDAFAQKRKPNFTGE
jgi:methylglutaconyl-CoA hydratase